MLVPYNLRHWISIRQSFIMLYVIIPSPSSTHEMKIDIYREPLISELKELWDVRVWIYDVTSKRYFMMRAALMWIINYFPPYGDLSMWSRKGHCMSMLYRHY
jgi:hypothetical protein